MENNYRDMMDAVKAPEGLRMEVMKMSEQERTKKTRPLPVRVALAAACICALLATAAIAAEALGFDFVKIFPDGEKKVIQGTVQGQESEGIQEWELDYEVDGSGVEYIPLEDFSPAVQALTEQYKDTDRHEKKLMFDSWEEAEEYLGYEIMDNSVLAQGKYFPVRLSREGEPLPGNCEVSIHIRNGGDISTINVTSKIDMFEETPEKPHGIEWYEVSAILYVGEPLVDLPNGPSVGYKLSDGSTVEWQESYQTPNGLETVLVNIERAPTTRDDGSEYRGGEYHAHFFLRGVRLEVWGTYSAENQEATLTRLKQILDSFE